MKTSFSSMGIRALPTAQLLLVVALVAPRCCGLAQGTLDFKNFGTPGLNAPVFLPDGVTKLGAGFIVFLLAGPASNSLALIDHTNFLTGSQAGYFDGGVEVITGVPGRTPAFVELQFMQSKLFPPTPSPFQTIPPSYPWLWGASPLLSASLGDPFSQPPIPAGTVDLGTAPIILAMPTLVAHQTDTNTLAFSWHVAPAQYALVAKYLLQRTSDLNQANWTTLTITDFLDFAVLPRPSETTFYRMAIE